MGAVPAYSYQRHQYSERAPERAPRPHVRVVPGQGTRTAPSALPSSVILVAKVVAIAFAVVTVVALARIALMSATVELSMESQTLSSDISSARSAGSDLEVAQSSLSNPTRIKSEASSLNMAEPGSVATIDLGQDVVATDGNGNLSLSKSIALAAAAGA